MTATGGPPTGGGPRPTAPVTVLAVRVIIAETDLTAGEAELLLRFHARVTRVTVEQLAWSTVTGRTGTEQLLWSVASPRSNVR